MTASAERDADVAEDWPAMGDSWTATLESLAREMKTLERAIAALPDERLSERAPAKEPQTFYELFHGIVQHCAYHAGQIALLRKIKA